MDNCNKYQSLFVFRDENELNEHLEICPVCRQKHDEMLKLESFIKSAQPIHQKRIQARIKLNKITASLALMLVVSIPLLNYISIISPEINPKHHEVVELINNSIFNQMKLPTDEFGLMDSKKEIFND